jgi:DNA-binding NtrC family response regulator
MSQHTGFNHLFEIACRSDANVLIAGPTGSGKTMLARRIHEQSKRKSKPFISVNVATLHEGTFESELFGHERGAFTGADQRRQGRLEAAQGGTVFLDEVGELSPKLQARLLEFLQSKTICPVGGSREIRLDVRVITATHRNLPKAVACGEFREDLFHRLRVISFQLKSLMERADEFDAILHGCLEEVCINAGKSILRISEAVAAKMESYSWPGNFRELRNVLEFAVLASSGQEIMLSDLPQWFIEEHQKKYEVDDRITEGARLLGVAQLPLTLDYYGTTSRFEKEYLERALRLFGGRVNLTARKIGMNKTTLIRRMRAYGIRVAIEVVDQEVVPFLQSSIA